MLVINKMYPPEMGGIEVVARQVVEAMSDKKVTVLTYNSSNETIEECQGDVKLIRLASIYSKGSIRWSVKFRKKIKELVKEHETVMYHYPSFQPELYRVKFKTKIVYYHADITKFGLIGNMYQRIITNRFLKDADKIIVSNPNIIESSKLLKKYENRCEVLHYGIDTNHFKYREENKRSVLLQNGEETIILFVGRMARYKGFHQLIESLSQLEDTYRLVVVSKDEYSMEDQDYIRNNKLQDRITKINNVSYNLLPEYYNAADILVMPSTNRAEAFGLVAVEAMACGIPVLTTELGTGTSYHNIHGVTGEVINPSSVDEIVNGIKLMKKKKYDKSRLIERANEFSIEQFNRDIKRVVKR